MANELQELQTEEKRQNMGEYKHSEKEKLKAAYALNMCTVSVSQIIDYHDAYILEQEYDAILNNLNLKEIPKDEALLKILSELLNTITFFRIQEIKKNQIEKKYQRRVKEAIWSAVPSLSVVVSGNPVAIAFALATQIGTGYMNYRKEKCNALADREDAEIELQITAIEQLNALKRELFTTAWRLADEYDFDDKWRLTERQIAQYNEILMDQNEYRKYVRLESIQDKFEAYPPFWYFFGHTANYIAENTDKDEVKQLYRKRAKEHFDHFYKMAEFSILREDQLTASFALEYADILYTEESRDDKKIQSLLKLAIEKAGNSFDVFQLCSIMYLKIGDTENAAKYLRILVNEGYNLSVNVKLLSRLYVSQYLFSESKEIKEQVYAEYQLLDGIVDNKKLLFPMPKIFNRDPKREDQGLLENYIGSQRENLQKDYRDAIFEFIELYIVKFNKLWPVPGNINDTEEDYFANSSAAKEKRDRAVRSALSDGEYRNTFLKDLQNCLFRSGYIDLLNQMITSLDELRLFREYDKKSYLLSLIDDNLYDTKKIQKDFVDCIARGNIDFKKYSEFQDKIAFPKFTRRFFDELSDVIYDQIENADMKDLDILESDLIIFCEKNGFSIYEKERMYIGSEGTEENTIFFQYELLGSDLENEEKRRKKRSDMEKAVKESLNQIISDSTSELKIILSGESEFKTYFANRKLRGLRGNSIKIDTIGILDDRTRRNADLLLCYSGVHIVESNNVKPIIQYKNISYSTTKRGKDELKFWPTYKYHNKYVNMKKLDNLIQKLAKIIENE